MLEWTDGHVYRRMDECAEKGISILPELKGGKLSQNGDKNDSRGKLPVAMFDRKRCISSSARLLIT